MVAGRALYVPSMECQGRAVSTEAKKGPTVAVCQLNVDIDPSLTPMANRANNLANAKAAIEKAHEETGADIVVLGECFNCPYDVTQFQPYSEPIPTNMRDIVPESHPSTSMLSGVAKELGIYLIGGSFPELRNGKVYNTSVVFSPEGELIAKHAKVHLFDIDIPGKQSFKESDSLTAGDSVTTFDTPWCKIGLAICYDIRFPQLAVLMREENCKLLVYPGAFNTTTGPLHWELLQRARAVDNQCAVVTASPARNPNSAYQAWGHSTIVDSWGNVVATCDEKPTIISAEIDLEKVDQVRQNIPISKQRRFDVYSDIKPSSIYAARWNDN